ncbi:MAG: hypothetical protein ACRDD2_05055 [Sarcina sp.]
MKRYKKGYLIVEIAVASSILSIFLVVIGSIFNSYLNLKKTVNYNDLDYGVIRELHNNLDYEKLNNLEKGVYKITIENLEQLKGNDILNLIEKPLEENRLDYKLRILNKEENFIEYEMIKEENTVGFIKFKGN